MSSDDEFLKFIRFYKDAHPSVSKQENQKTAVKEWNRLKGNREALLAETVKLRNAAAQIRSKQESYWNRISVKRALPENDVDIQELGRDLRINEIPTDAELQSCDYENEQTSTPASDRYDRADKSAKVSGAERSSTASDDAAPTNLFQKKPYPRRAQEQQEKEILRLSMLVAEGDRIVNSSLANGQLVQQHKKNCIEHAKAVKKLERLKGNMKTKSKARLKQTVEAGPKPAKLGRPPLETKYPDLLKVITDIVTNGHTMAQDRRRDESIRMCRTLDDLTAQLNLAGIEIKRSATYLRLLPHKAGTNQSSRHVSTVNAKIVRAQKDSKRMHKDFHCAAAAQQYLRDLAAFLGHDSVNFLSIDDKAQVPLAMAAATIQSPVIMHMKYRVRLPDHDFPVGERHKLIPSVYGLCNVKPFEGISYSGPTFIKIRSAKHDTPTSSAHFADLDDMLIRFKDRMTANEAVKPVMIISVDNGPGMKPTSIKLVRAALHFFRKHNLDALFIFSYTPGNSAYNIIERRMAPLSLEIGGTKHRQILQKNSCFENCSAKNLFLSKTFCASSNVQARIFFRNMPML